MIYKVDGGGALHDVGVTLPKQATHRYEAAQLLPATTGDKDLAYLVPGLE